MHNVHVPCVNIDKVYDLCWTHKTRENNLLKLHNSKILVYHNRNFI